MNWITKFIKPKIQSILKRQSKKTEDSLWVACDCQEPIFKEDLVKNLYVCPKCEKHHKLSSRERFNIFFDEGNYDIVNSPKFLEDPLGFEDRLKYTERLKAARNKTKQDDAILVAQGKLEGVNVTCTAQNFDFIGGSVGAASGEALIAAVQNAINNKTSLISFSSSGGQRMMESSIALMQMPRTVIAINELKKERLPYVVVFCNPTTGGVSASWAGISDIAIGEPKSTIGFAGRRVIQSTIGSTESLPESFQTAESVLKHGRLDMIVERKNLRSTISNVIKILLKIEEKNINANDSNVVTIDDPLRKSTA